MNKESILKEIISQEELFIDRLKESLNSYKTASDLDEEATMDRQDMSQANQAKDMQMRLRVQLDKANADLDELKKISAGKYASVEGGALVETEKKYFFIGVSIHTLEINGKDVLGVSSDSPAFKTMYGHTAGEEFTLGNDNYKILSIS